MHHIFENRKGQVSLQILILSTVIVILASGFVMWAGSLLNASYREFNKGQAFTIAEAGVEYYRWHLAHAPLDYHDGTGGAGPYVHTYYDKDGNAIGSFTLEITPPPLGSRVVTVRSTGKVNADASVQKIVEAKLGIASFAKYAWALNSDVNFGSAAEVFGPVHSNGGVHFDGVAHNLVTSAQTSYNDPDHSGGNEFGVHTHSGATDPLPPSAVPLRADVFMAGRQFPVQAVDFTAITQNLAQIKADAQVSGFYRASSTAQGYDVVLKTDGTFDLYRVNSLVAAPGGCTTPTSTYSINSETLLGNYSLISGNGLIFLEDNVWVRGTVSSTRMTIASGRFPDNPATRSSITINSDVRYSNTNGSDTIGIISQNNINIGLVSADNLRIDGAIIAQNGRVGRASYAGCGSNATRATLTINGAIISNLRSGFVYSGTNGYQARTYVYDGNLLYGPPPSFPLTTDQYTPISWDEVK